MTFKNKLLIAGTLLSATLASPAQAGSWQQNVTVGNFNKVHVYTPDSLSPIGQGRSLLVVLHGCTQSIDAYLSANLEQAAETYGMVVAVPDAMNKAGFGCWSYWQGAKSRTAGDYANILSLVSTMKASSSYAIDDDQVYVAGLSSGAAFANTTACIAPDVFAGVGVSAGPSIGTSSSGAIGSCEYADVATRCQQYAGSYSGSLNDQIASIAHGDADTTVDTCYNRQNAEGMAGAYGVNELPGSNPLGSGTRTAEEYLWEEGRVSMIWLNGVDHSWSGGAGASGSYVSGTGINYAMYLGEYFTENNKRVDRNQPPVLANVNAIESSGQLVVTGTATDVEGVVDNVDVLITNNNGDEYQYATATQSDNSFSLTSAALADDLYYVSVTASDDVGAVSDAITVSVRVGPPPPPAAPVLSDVLVDANGQCATVTGSVYDENQDLTAVEVTFATGSQNASVDGLSFSAEACDLPGGVQTITVTAIDASGLSSNTQLSVDIDAGVIATLDQHISAGRLDYTGYSTCYLEYSTDAFKLTEQTQSGGMCVWQDDDASCTGPVQACSGSGSDGGGSGGGNDGGDPATCADYTTANYYHKVAGRAYSTGYYYAPDYFASGSDDSLAGSTWGTSTLYSTDGTVWYEGSCP
ncbi:PHB depolymerase family esterase [uncultured Alteromonas sp.]|jgi:poly(hydroxyalkanoate) depolymerase family esterase|uniref:extracellular catalytic domain type 1 short-chain-length polyhydroxyalkanoate depolymerase n=1 Tax=uncultured Alteromonas sp. TaxID=179113 RepID=UPI0025DFBD6C|nr:PHB depolymerase family esterase [uncultured Alteromonas sp.]